MSSRKKSLARFCERGGDLYDTSLRGARDHRPCDSSAIAHWHLTRAVARPTCFGCRGYFNGQVKPAAFLMAAPIRDRSTVAVAALCERCWTLPPDQIELVALGVLRRQLCPHGRWLDGGWS